MAKSNETTLIDLLKKNRYAFGMWTDPECYGPEIGKEMQEKASEIGKQYFQFYQYSAGGFKAITGKYDATFFGDHTYRLRPDYEEEPEIEECEIYLDNDDFSYKRFGDARPKVICRADNDPDFIGFKFEDGVVSGVPVRYLLTCGHFNTFAFKEFAEVKVLHATHVLFRRQK